MRTGPRSLARGRPQEKDGQLAMGAAQRAKVEERVRLLEAEHDAIHLCSPTRPHPHPSLGVGGVVVAASIVVGVVVLVVVVVVVTAAVAGLVVEGE